MDELMELLEDTNWAMNNLLSVFQKLPNKYPMARHEIEVGIKELNDRAAKIMEKRHSLTDDEADANARLI